MAAANGQPEAANGQPEAEGLEAVLRHAGRPQQLTRSGSRHSSSGGHT